MLITEQVWWSGSSDNYWKQVKYPEILELLQNFLASCTCDCGLQKNILSEQSNSIVQIIQFREESQLFGVIICNLLTQLLNFGFEDRIHVMYD